MGTPSAAPGMPYMDAFLVDISSGEGRSPFERHVHWGYWEQPDAADGTQDDFVAATEAMSGLVCDAAGVADGMRVLDVGCGIGGTLASIDQRHTGMDLVGLNIDERQLAVAEQRVATSATNPIAFVHGDACALPFPDDSFDAVLAIECIFHFKSRRRFLKEVHRVLRPGGRLGVSDFVPVATTMAALTPLNWSLPFFGDRNRVLQTMSTYRLLARSCGLRIREARDVTANTIPGYAVIQRYLGDVAPPAVRQAQTLERVSRRGLLRYKVLSFENG